MRGGRVIMRAPELSLCGDDLVEFARQRERERLWASATLMICALGIVAVVVVLAVGAAVEALADKRGASAAAEIGPACMPDAQPRDYPDACVEEFDGGF